MTSATRNAAGNDDAAAADDATSTTHAVSNKGQEAGDKDETTPMILSSRHDAADVTISGGSITASADTTINNG